MNAKKHRVCPVALSGSLDNRLRRWFQNPRKILQPYIKEGMTVLDVGCGPGFFTIDIAQLVGPSGQVIAADLQEGMLRIIRDKVQSTELENRFAFHQCEKDRIGLTEKVDFVLAFYMVHETPDQDAFFAEIAPLLNSGGQVFISEPPFHVSKAAFKKTIAKAEAAGLVVAAYPKTCLSNAVILVKR